MVTFGIPKYYQTDDNLCQISGTTEYTFEKCIIGKEEKRI